MISVGNYGSLLAWNSPFRAVGGWVGGRACGRFCGPGGDYYWCLRELWVLFGLGWPPGCGLLVGGVCPGSRAWHLCAPRLARGILLVSFSDTLLVVSI